MAKTPAKKNRKVKEKTKAKTTPKKAPPKKKEEPKAKARIPAKKTPPKKKEEPKAASVKPANPRVGYSIFDDALAKAYRAGYSAADTKKAAKWLFNLSLELGQKVTPNQLMKEDARLTAVPQIGRLYHYIYDAKLKKKLPYWDKFVLTIPFKMKEGLMTGINLHYLPPLWRAKLLKALFDITSNKKFDETTKLKISYKVLDSASKFKSFRPCIHSYLPDHIKSPFLQISWAESPIAIALPTARFQKAPESFVWSESLKKIGVTR